ncbi:MAG TPA: hypothetical protein VK034_06390 [Enhygromyxa sp.]|nr:hypothetical protein [Enhygromyxa sp.]
MAQPISASRDRLEQLGAMFGDLQVRVHARPKTGEIVLQAVKHPLNLELFGKPVARERLGVILQGRADHGAEHAARQLLPEVPTMVGAREIQRDLSVIEPMIVRQMPQKQRVNDLMDEVRQPLGFDDPRTASQIRQFVGGCSATKIFSVAAKEDCSPHFLDHERNQASQIGAR